MIFESSGLGLLNQGKKIFFSYHEDLSKIKESIRILENVVKSDPTNVEAMIIISRAFLTYGDLVPKTDDERIKAYKSGKMWAEKALKVDENSAQAHLWYFANLGRLQEIKGLLYGLRTLPELKKHILKAYELAPSDVMIVEALGVFYRDAPGIVGGDLEKAEKFLREAIKIDPNYTLSYLDLAVLLYNKKKYNEAKITAEKVLQIKNPTFIADWATWDKPKAEELLKKIEKEYQ